MIKPEEEINEIDDVTPFVYIYVRKDLPPVQQLIQAAHAAHEAGTSFGKMLDENEYPQTSHFCVFEVKNEKELMRVDLALDTSQVQYERFFEPDFDMGYTAIATEPLRGERRTLVPNCQLLRLPKRHIW